MINNTMKSPRTSGATMKQSVTLIVLATLVLAAIQLPGQTPDPRGFGE